MTRILYIPTGEFLRFNDGKGPGDFTQTRLEIMNLNAEIEIYELINYTKKHVEEIIPVWIEENKIKFPILREELEIIYD